MLNIFQGIVLLLLAITPAWGHENMQLTINVGDEAVKGTLEKNAITEQLLKLIPMKLEMEDFNYKEKIAYPPSKLDLSNAKRGLTPKTGDIGIYGPWGNICIFYHDGAYSDELYYLGKITSGLNILAAQKRNFQAIWEINE